MPLNITGRISHVAISRISGQAIRISGDSVITTSGQVRALVSGDVVKVSGATLIGKVSGETVISKVSGEAVKVSGETVKVSGEVVRAEVSGDVVKISGEVVKVSGEVVRAEVSGDIVKISGEAVKVSGATLIGKISGETVITKISGEAVKVSGETVALASGTGPISVSGQPIKISGETVSIETPTEIKTGAIRVVTAASGGAVLHSGAVLSVNVKSLSGDIWIGGATNRPYSGFGFLIAGGEAKSIDVDDFNRVYLCASTSGDWVTFMGVK